MKRMFLSKKKKPNICRYVFSYLWGPCQVFGALLADPIVPNDTRLTNGKMLYTLDYLMVFSNTGRN